MGAFGRKEQRAVVYVMSDSSHSPDRTYALVLVQNHQLSPFIRTGRPGFVLGQCNIGKHYFIEADRAGFASAA
jgi:hypothetical protein